MPQISVVEIEINPCGIEVLFIHEHVLVVENDINGTVRSFHTWCPLEGLGFLYDTQEIFYIIFFFIVFFL